MTEAGEIIETAKEIFKYVYLDNGGVELVPEDYLEVCFRALRTLSAKARDGKIQAICASSASGNTVFLDKNNVPMMNIISWQDKRVTNEAREVLADLDTEKFYRLIGWPYGFRAFPLSALCYMKIHNPKMIEDCGMVAMSTEYLYYKLTGKWGISPSAGTTYCLFEQETGKYIPWLLERLGITEQMLPPVMPCGTVVGLVQEGLEEITGIPSGTPVVLGTFDHPSAARGVEVLEEGQMLLSCGTSWVALLPIINREKGFMAKGLVDPFLSPEGPYAVMSSIPSVSGRLKLYVNRYISDSKQAFSELSKLARLSVPGANGLTLQLMEEPNDSYINQYEKKDIARAIMEGTISLLKERLSKLSEVGIVAKEAVMVGGPSEDPYWSELIEQMCNIKVHTKHGSMAGAVGAAKIARKG
jgi:sugar (pentulose or hexulose) kinase